jgi:methyltransferase (TIGR00027 family)
MKPVSLTAFYCCGIRMLDARSPRPVCGDTLAERFIDDRGFSIVEAFRPYLRPNASNVARHRIIDDLLRARLAADPGLRIVSIGAGFDTRPYRLAGGRWVEVDEADLLAYKDARLPVAEAPNELVRIAVDFDGESLTDRLAGMADGRPVVVVAEGISMYLGEARLRALARALKGLFPRCELICDLMTRPFLARYADQVHAELQKLGAGFALTEAHPATIFETEGFRVRARHSIARRAMEEGTLAMPGWAVDVFLTTLREGYAVWVFEPASAPL